VTQGQAGRCRAAPCRDVTRRACLGVRAPRALSQGRLAPSQRLASQDASCSAPSRMRRAFPAGPFADSSCVRTPTEARRRTKL
jgi:hypothetical protein